MQRACAGCLRSVSGWLPILWGATLLALIAAPRPCSRLQRGSSRRSGCDEDCEEPPEKPPKDDGGDDIRITVVNNNNNKNENNNVNNNKNENTNINKNENTNINNNNLSQTVVVVSGGG